MASASLHSGELFQYDGSHSIMMDVIPVIGESSYSGSHCVR